MSIKIDEYTDVELAIIQALVGRRRKFSELKRDTLITGRWLALRLKELRDGPETKPGKRPKKHRHHGGVVRKCVDAKNNLLGWELEPKWLEENAELAKLLGTLRALLDKVRTKAERDPAIKDGPPMFMPMMKVLGAFMMPFLLACVMQFYREDKLLKLIENQTIREAQHVVVEAFYPIKKMNKSQLLENIMGMGPDPTKMTFEQFMKKLPTVEELDNSAKKMRFRPTLLT